MIPVTQYGLIAILKKKRMKKYEVELILLHFEYYVTSGITWLFGQKE